MQRYQPLIQAVAAACQGNEEAKQQITPILQQMAQGDETNRRFAEVAHRILAGERNEEVLTNGLEGITALIVRAIFQQLSGEAPPPQPVAAAAEPAGEPTFAEFLNQLLNGVAAASQPNAPAGLRGQLLPLTQSLAQDTSLSPDIRALGQALFAILNGRQPDLTALPPELAAAVRQAAARR